jgi:hypothetical protein
MYSRQEASKLRQEFWTSFGQYMNPVLSADGMKVNWVNYKTGEKDISFRMEANNRDASVYIELSHKDPGIRQLYFEQFGQLRTLLEQETGSAWEWIPQMQDEHGRQVSRIAQRLEGVNIMKKEDWPRLISFFKPAIIALDEFWSGARYSFEALR